MSSHCFTWMVTRMDMGKKGDLLPGTPYNKQVAHCCKAGVLSSWLQDPTNSVASFQVTVGEAGTTNRTVNLPKNFTLKTPGPGSTCGLAKIVRPTKITQPDKRRVTQALSELKDFTIHFHSCQI
ncbi:COBRA, plant [Sesbania bispinosa]|nr:COBRA, plant [Sesbania bispinosa]